MRTFRTVTSSIILIFLLFSFAVADGFNFGATEIQETDTRETLPIDFSAGKPWQKKNLLSDHEYKDPTIHVKLETGRYHETDYWLARISIKHASQLRTAAVGNFESFVEMSGIQLASRVKAVLAVNGDFFYYNGGAGFMVRQGKLIFNNPTGRQDILLIDDQGDFHVARMPRKNDLGLSINGRRVINAICFGPILTENGEACYNDAYGEAYGAELRRQRMAIAQTGPLEYLCICTGSPVHNSLGLTLNEFADFVTSFGVETAYNLDGGDSTLMVFCGKKFNDPLSSDARRLSDIIYFASAWSGKGK